MIYVVDFSPAADRVIKKWKKSNPKLHKKFLKNEYYKIRGWSHPLIFFHGESFSESQHHTDTEDAIGAVELVGA